MDYVCYCATKIITTQLCKQSLHEQACGPSMYSKSLEGDRGGRERLRRCRLTTSFQGNRVS